MGGMGFEQAKALILAHLGAGTVRHEPRPARKNLLQTGQLSLVEAAAIVAKTRGQEASSAPHHQDPSITVWVLRPDGWYIKCYLVDECWFISFHKAGESP